MKRKIYLNREVLRGKTFHVELSGCCTDFSIAFVTDKIAVINKSITYKKMTHPPKNSVENIVKNVILDDSVDNGLPLSRRAFQSSVKLKKIPIIIDGHKFEFKQITNSGVIIGLTIDLDEMIENEGDALIQVVKNVILNNLQDNPPQPKAYSGRVYNLPYLFQYGSSGMYFTSVGESREIVSEAELKRNKEKFKDQIEEEKRRNEKAEKFKKEMPLNKKSNTRDMARFR